MITFNEPTKRMVYLSPTYSGQTHDTKGANTEAIHSPPRATLTKDAGFQDYEPAGAWTLQPCKKPRGKELGIADRFFNRLISSVCMKVEHVIARIKHCRIVKEVFRNTKEGFSDLVMRVARTLPNWRSSFH